MAYTYVLRLCLTEQQLEKIKNDSKKCGFRHPPQYVRWFILNKATETEEKINTIYQLVKKQNEK